MQLDSLGNRYTDKKGNFDFVRAVKTQIATKNEQIAVLKHPWSNIEWFGF